jgi:hypothetical protein
MRVRDALRGSRAGQASAYVGAVLDRQSHVDGIGQI